MNPTNTEQVFQKALEFHQSGQLAEAEKHYLQVLERSPSFSGVYGNLAELYFRQGKGDAALTLLKEGERQFPEDLGILTAMCAFNARLNKPEVALKYALKVVELNPSYVDGYFNLGSLYMQTNEPIKAIGIFEKAIEMNPELVHAHLNLGILYYGQSMLEKAGTSFEKVVEMAPDHLQSHINLGVVRTDEGLHEAAIDSFRKALSIDPNAIEAHQRLGMSLHFTGDIVGAIHHYEEALQKGGHAVTIQTLLGNGYRDIGEVDKAQYFYKKVLEADPDNEEVQSNLQRITSNKISYWHLEMLADSARNEAYYKAILAGIKEGDTVLDIGTGSGLLAMMAVKAGAKKVYACEMVPALASVAQQVVKDNGMSDKIEVLNLKSTSLMVGRELPERADIVVSEILDCGLLGEGVLPSLRHAYANLLKPGARSIPQSADVYAVLIQANDYKGVNPVKEIAGFDLSAFEQFRVADTYQKVDLKVIPHQKLSDVFHLQHVDFKELPDLKVQKDPLRKTLSVKATADGHWQAVAFWFTLHVDSSTSLSTGPDGEMIHWGQALYFLKREQEVKAGEMVELTLLQSEMSILFE